MLISRSWQQAVHSRAGQSLIELLIAIALSAVLLPGLLTAMVAAREGKAQEQQRLQAIALAREADEAVRSVREKGWSHLQTNGTYYPVISGGAWSLTAGTETSNGFTRSVVLSDVYRDSSGAIVASGGTLDPGTKRVVTTVAWTQPVANSVQTTHFLTRNLQNAEHRHTTQADFNAGTFVNAQSTANGGGTIQLSVATNSATFTDEYTNSSLYTYDPAKVEVTGGVAQLKNQGVTVNGATSNPTFDTLMTGWTFASYGNSVLQTGTRAIVGGNPNAYAQVNFPASRNNLSGGYYYQPFTTTVASPSATVAFDWRVTGYQATPDNFTVYVWVDKVATGTPTTVAWSSGPITATSAWAGPVTVDISSLVATPGTYYVKVGAYVDYPSANRGPYTVGFDDVQVNWSGQTAVYASDSPTVYHTNSVAPTGVISWTSFAATEILNGGSIRYQISSAEGENWSYYDGTKWANVTTSTNYNSASEINQRISTFQPGNGKLRIKAFLIGNGTQQVKLDKVTLGYIGGGGSATGSFTSSTFDSGSAVMFNRLLWSETNTADTTTQLQVAINADNSTWNYVGPDGTATTYFTGGLGSLPLSLVSGRYARYKVFFTSTGTDIPVVSDVTLNYSP